MFLPEPSCPKLSHNWIAGYREQCPPARRYVTSVFNQMGGQKQMHMRMKRAHNARTQVSERRTVLPPGAESPYCPPKVTWKLEGNRAPVLQTLPLGLAACGAHVACASLKVGLDDLKVHLQPVGGWVADRAQRTAASCSRHRRNTGPGYLQP